MDPNPPRLNNQTGPQPGTSGQMSKRPAKYLSMEYITLCLKSNEYDFLRELSDLIQTPENAYGISCITNLPDATFVCIRQEHTGFGLSVKKSSRNVWTFSINCHGRHLQEMELGLGTKLKIYKWELNF